MARRVTPPLEAAVRRELLNVAKRSPGASKSVLAELALALAKEIETAGYDAPLAARVSAGKLLLETLDRITATAPAEPVKDRLDELAAKRERRVAKA